MSKIYKCIIVDDEELARNLIKNHLNQLDDFEIFASCETAIEASKIIQQQSVDLLFLDIEMPVLRGTEFLKNLIHKPKVIFTTAYRDYAIEGFELNAVDYLLKPITFGRFLKAIEKFLALQDNNRLQTNVLESSIKPDFIFIRKDRKQVKVFFNDILYIESIKDYIRIHLPDDNYVTKHSITTFLELLDDRFLRTHRSYIVNKDKVTAYTKHDVEIGKTEIPIGDSFRDVLHKLTS
ncbi:LytTR family DNA-binding domain-containing protein [Aquimarina sp. D1M17]|uniref:LytR/AlgR family response regulator transcription factor n=1 Tax=Aquimarina acroporae TaxID=2937283 RepID=UPI0020C13C20|nr:LytTR family DNA-binding domain-containing protein [Aquimarina acroporae]MCK8524290.1 LytTR family DNA-binding domain-containing protein [Aquimarina acroporae]